MKMKVGRNKKYQSALLGLITDRANSLHVLRIYTV